MLNIEFTITASSVSVGSPYPAYPLSAAQAMMNRAHSGAHGSSYDRSTVGGNSLGSYGNSLASLSGWGNTEASPSDKAEPVEIENGELFVDIL